jgi:hypothetical protein
MCRCPEPMKSTLLPRFIVYAANRVALGNAKT